MCSRRTLVVVLLVAVAGDVLIAQLEFGAGPIHRWGWERVSSSGIHGDDLDWYGNGLEAFATYRFSDRLGFGVTSNTIQRSTRAVATSSTPANFAGLSISSTELVPTISYRPCSGLILDAGVGRSFVLGTRAQLHSGFTDEFTNPLPVSAADYTVVRGGLSAVAGVGYLRVGYAYALAHQASTAAGRNVPLIPDGPNTRWHAFDLTVGLRFGPAVKRYGRPASVDTLVTRTFQPLEDRFPRWRVSVDQGVVFGTAVGSSVEPTDNFRALHVGLTAARGLEAAWSLRTSLNTRWTRINGGNQGDTLEYSNPLHG